MEGQGLTSAHLGLNPSLTTFHPHAHGQFSHSVSHFAHLRNGDSNNIEQIHCCRNAPVSICKVLRMLPVHHRSKVSIASYSAPGSPPALGFHSLPDPYPCSLHKPPTQSCSCQLQVSPVRNSSPQDLFLPPPLLPDRFSQLGLESLKLLVLEDRRPDNEFVP